MNEDTLKGQWKHLRGEITRRWGKLTDNDLDQINGDEEKLMGKLQERYGYAKDRARTELDGLFAGTTKREPVGTHEGD